MTDEVANPYSDFVRSHYEQPRNLGHLSDATHKARLLRGDAMLEFHLRVVNSTIVAASYRVIGCAATVAAGSALTEWLIDRSVQEATRLSGAEILAILGDLPHDRRYAAEFAADAVRLALQTPA